MTEDNLPSEIGLAVVLMEETGPQTTINLSDLDEIASIYLAVKGFTAFMTGFERDDFGPGKIRGILQIPATEKYAIAFDHVMKGIGNEEDLRMRHSRVAIISLISSEEDLKYIRTYYSETEKFLAEQLMNIFSVAVLTETFVEKLKKDYNKFLKKLASQGGAGETRGEPQSLFDVTLLLSLPKDENLTARCVMELATDDTEQSFQLKDICKLTKRKKKDELSTLEKLIEKGLIIVIPHEKHEEVRYIVK